MRRNSRGDCPREVSRVQQPDTSVSDSKTHECLAVRHTSVQQLDTAVSNSKTPTERDNNNLKNNKLNNDTNSKAKTIGSGFDFVGNEGTNRAAAAGGNREEEGPISRRCARSHR